MFGMKKRGVKEKSRTPPGEDRISSPIPAPGGLAVVQSFLNTFDFKKRHDQLATPRDLSDWMSRQGILPAGTRLTKEDLSRALAARAGLCALIMAQNGYKIGEKWVAKLDRAGMGARSQVRFEPDGTTRIELVSRHFDDALGTLLGLVHAAQAAKIWPRFKACANRECHAAFYDFSKGGQGRWCTKRCGDRIRAREFRRKRKHDGWLG